MTKHIINIEDFVNTTFEHLLASSAGKESNKQLVAVVSTGNHTHSSSVTYRVVDHKEIIIETKFLGKAIQFYNEGL